LTPETTCRVFHQQDDYKLATAAGYQLLVAIEAEPFDFAAQKRRAI